MRHRYKHIPRHTKPHRPIYKHTKNQTHKHIQCKHTEIYKEAHNHRHTDIVTDTLNGVKRHTSKYILTHPDAAEMYRLTLLPVSI